MNASDYKHLLPIAIEVEQGKSYTWCGCGLSEDQPFCDRVNCTKSLTIRANLNEMVNFCNCKQTKTPPWCDGSHASLLLDALKQSKV
ncbi:MAG: CDGSH iron-sulfur domain-containing protein [Legionella sp.]|nr:CDGSH iron-sulfur domain-containing protein [Legionella sp.]